LASLRPSVTSLSQGICCHLFASADGLMTVASRVSSAALGEGCLASAGAWARTSRAGPCAPAATTRTATRSNRRAPRTKLVRDMVISLLSRDETAANLSFLSTRPELALPHDPPNSLLVVFQHRLEGADEVGLLFVMDAEVDLA